MYTDGPFESNELRGPTHSLSGHTRPLPIIAPRVGNFVSIYRPATEKASLTATRGSQGDGRTSVGQEGEVAIMKRRGLLLATSSRRAYTMVLSACPRTASGKIVVPTDYQSNRMFAAKGLSQFFLFLSISLSFTLFLF